MRKKITLATVKSFLKKNAGHLHIKVTSQFDSNIDSVVNLDKATFEPAKPDTKHVGSTLGFKNCWFVGSSRDYFKPYNDGRMQGYEVSNCTGSFVVAITFERSLECFNAKWWRKHHYAKKGLIEPRVDRQFESEVERLRALVKRIKEDIESEDYSGSISKATMEIIESLETT